MFSQACVKNSVHRGGGVYPSMLVGRPPGQTPPLPSADVYCSGRYASYWNAFLFIYLINRSILKYVTLSFDNFEKILFSHQGLYDVLCKNTQLALPMLGMLSAQVG